MRVCFQALKKGGLIRETISSSQAPSDAQVLEKQVIVGRVALLRFRPGHAS